MNPEETTLRAKNYKHGSFGIVLGLVRGQARCMKAPGFLKAMLPYKNMELVRACLREGMPEGSKTQIKRPDTRGLSNGTNP